MKITRSAVSRFRASLVLVSPLIGVAVLAGGMPSMAQAQDAASAIAGVAVPKGATRPGDTTLESGLSRMIAAAADLFKLPERSGGPGKVDVFYWQGSAYKAGRTLFMQTMLKSALTEAGYSYQAVDAHVSNIPNVFDTNAYDTGALKPNPWDPQPAYFYGTNPKTGKTIVGVWFDQEHNNRTVLVIGEAGFAGAPAETKIPTITDPNVWLIKDFKNATKGMPDAPLPSFPQIAAKPGTVRGMVKDGAGKPIAGAHLIAWASAAGGFRTSYKGTTNAQGIYEIQLPIGICQVVNADCRVTYNDQTLTLPLHPADGERDEFDSRTGHVENFVLRTSGATGEGSGNYGGTVRINTHNAPMGSTVEVTLKPTGTLIDGSRGKTLVFRYPIKTTLPETIVAGLPIGRYQMTAKLYDGEDALPLQLRKTFTENVGDDLPLGNSLMVEFASQSSSIANQGQSGVRRFEVTIQP